MLNHYVAHFKLIQYCKSTILKLKIMINKIDYFTPKKNSIIVNAITINQKCNCSI